MDAQEAGWLIAHRLALAYLLGALRQLAPQEAEAQVVADTLTMLEQSVPALVATLPPVHQVQVEEAAVAELRRILRGVRFPDR